MCGIRLSRAISCVRGVAGAHLEIRIVRRDLEQRVDRHSANGAVFGRLLGEAQADVAAILQRLAVGRVVHLKGERGAGLHQHRRARQQLQRILTGSVADQDIARIGRPVRFVCRLLYESDDVMDHGALSGANLGRFHPLVLREVAWEP